MVSPQSNAKHSELRQKISGKPGLQIATVGSSLRVDDRKRQSPTLKIAISRT